VAQKWCNEGEAKHAACKIRAGLLRLRRHLYAAAVLDVTQFSFVTFDLMTEQVNLAVTICTRIRQVRGLDLGWDISYPD
jgi:hypothetical protein